MRIIGGRLKGRRLLAPDGRGTRPSSDRLRESVFNILAHGDYPPLAGARVADIFAGSGALGLEALSRGAAKAVFVETARPALSALERNAGALGLDARVRILRCDATRLPRAGAPVDIAFLDPPYGKGLAEPALASLLAGGWLAPEALVVVETGSDEALITPAGLTLVDRRDIGGSRLWLLSPNAPQMAESQCGRS